ncbi:MAG: DUF433 domain-containing protein [Prochloraceae cyanobacterium]|nr:DUF433 domain-containing protein [Prochloraceae cyanobacterium]
MQVEDYFNFLAPNDIRIKGSRIGIETILYEYIYRAKTPEEIAGIYTSLTLEQVYATILYYLHEQEKISQYMTDWLEYCFNSAKEQDKNPPSHILKLKQIKAQRKLEKQIMNEHSISNR